MTRCIGPALQWLTNHAFDTVRASYASCWTSSVVCCYRAALLLRVHSAASQHDAITVHSSTDWPRIPRLLSGSVDAMITTPSLPRRLLARTIKYRRHRSGDPEGATANHVHDMKKVTKGPIPTASSPTTNLFFLFLLVHVLNSRTSRPTTVCIDNSTFLFTRASPWP